MAREYRMVNGRAVPVDQLDAERDTDQDEVEEDDNDE